MKYKEFLVESNQLEKKEISERCLHSIKECYKLAKNEMKEYHENENKEEIAERWLGEYIKMNNVMMNELIKECEGIMASQSQYGQA